MDDWQDAAHRKIGQKRLDLQAKDFSSDAAEGAVEWAWGIAQHHVPPESNPEGFLKKLDRMLDRCEKWARAEQDFWKS